MQCDVKLSISALSLYKYIVIIIIVYTQFKVNCKYDLQYNVFVFYTINLNYQSTHIMMPPHQKVPAHKQAVKIGSRIVNLGYFG